MCVSAGVQTQRPPVSCLAVWCLCHNWELWWKCLRSLGFKALLLENECKKIQISSSSIRCCQWAPLVSYPLLCVPPGLYCREDLMTWPERWLRISHACIPSFSLGTAQECDDTVSTLALRLSCFPPCIEADSFLDSIPCSWFFSSLCAHWLHTHTHTLIFIWHFLSSPVCLTVWLFPLG